MSLGVNFFFPLARQKAFIVGVIIAAGRCFLEPVKRRREITAHASAFHIDPAHKGFRRTVILICASLQKIQTILSLSEK